MASEFKNYIKEDFDLSDYMLLETFASLGEVLESTALSPNDDKAKNDKYAKIKEKSKQYYERLKEAVKKLIKKIVEKLNVFKELLKTANGFITIHDWDLLGKDWNKFIDNVRKIPKIKQHMTEEEYNIYKNKVKEAIESFTNNIKEHKDQKKMEYKMAYNILSIKFNMITSEYNRIILPMGNDLLTQVAYNFYALFFTDMHKIVERFGTKEERKNSEEQFEKVKKQYGDMHNIKESTEFDFDSILEEGTLSLTIKQKIQALVEKIKKLIAKIISKFKANKNKYAIMDAKQREKRDKRVKISDWSNILRVITDLDSKLKKLKTVNPNEARAKAKEYFSAAHDKLLDLFDEKNLIEMNVESAIKKLENIQHILLLSITCNIDTMSSLISHTLSKLGSELSQLYASLDVSDLNYKIDRPDEAEEDRANNIPKEKKDMKESILSFTMESFDLETKDDKKQGMKKKIEEKWKKMIEAIRKMIARITDFLKSKMGMKLKEEEIKVINWKDVSLELTNLSKMNDENDITKTCDKIEKLLKRKVIMNVNEAYADAFLSNMTTKLFDLTSGVVNSKVATVVNKVITILNEEISVIMKKIEALDSKMTKETEVEESVMEEGAIKDKLSNVAEKGKKKITMALDKTMIVAFKSKYKKLSKEELSKVEKTAKSNYTEAVKIAKKESLVVKKYDSDVNKFLIIFMPDGLTMVAAKKLLAPVRKYSCELEAIKQLKNKPVKEGVEMIDDEIDYTTIIESCDITEDDILELDLESMTESELMELDGAEINRVLFEEYVDDDWFGYEYIREAFGKKDFDEDGKLVIPDINKFQEKALGIWKKRISSMSDDKLQKYYKNIKKELGYSIKAKEKKEARGPQKEMIHQILSQFLPLGNFVRQLMGNYDSYPARVIGMAITMGKAVEDEFKKEFKKRKLKPLAESVVEENESVVNESTSEYDVTDDGYILLDI